MPLYGNKIDSRVDISKLLRTGIENNPDNVALVSAIARWTWAELDTASTNLASNLFSLGLKPGDRVASLIPNRAPLLIHYLACMKAGLVSVPLNYRYMPPEIDHALEVCEASVLFAHAERDQDLMASKYAQKLPKGCIGFEAADNRSPCFEEMIASNALNSTLNTPKSSDPAFIFFTSGSTGPAKGVTHSFESLGWMFAGTAGAFEFTRNDIVLPGSSISHLGGFLFSFAALSVGARIVIARSFESDELLPLLRDDRPSVLCMPPTALLHLVRD